MNVRKADIIEAINQLNLDNKIVCIHSSLKSFGFVEGGAKTIINAFLDKGYTILVPSFTYDYALSPPVDDRPPRNGYNYNVHYDDSSRKDKIFTVQSNDISKNDMGAIPYEILRMPERHRGYNPLNSFTAIGPRAAELVAGQSPIDVYAPLKKLYEMGGYIILMGVDLTRMTAIHYAEEMAGRNLFIRWANGLDGKPIRVCTGSCSGGFNKFEPMLNNIERRIMVGKSLWRLFPMKEAMDICASAIKKDQHITRCENQDCERCRDAVQGGPIL